MTDESPRPDWIVPRSRVDGRIELHEYDPRWPERFAELAARIRRALGEIVVRLEHTGSTSVPGLVAKPIIDIALAVPDSTAEDDYVPALEAAGFELTLREPGWHEHRLLKDPARTVNLHVFSAGSVEIERMVAFRDWLRSHDDDRVLYERTKRDLAARQWTFVQDYADAKTEVVEEILARASAESR